MLVMKSIDGERISFYKDELQDSLEEAIGTIALIKTLSTVGNHTESYKHIDALYDGLEKLKKQITED